MSSGPTLAAALGAQWNLLRRLQPKNARNQSSVSTFFFSFCFLLPFFSLTCVRVDSAELFCKQQPSLTILTYGSKKNHSLPLPLPLSFQRRLFLIIIISTFFFKLSLSYVSSRWAWRNSAAAHWTALNPYARNASIWKVTPRV